MIKCHNITKTYGQGDAATQALKGITLSIRAGEFIAIMGPSGSGKSTLMHILGLLDTPTTGTYAFDGRDVSHFTEDELAGIRAKKIGFVFQSFNLLPRTDVVRNVALPLVYNNVPPAEREQLAHAALKAVNLAENRWHHLSNEISGGQKQRVAIARALVNKPKIIFADEPTGNLDTKTGDYVLQTFQWLNQREGHTIILITHEPYIARAASRIIRIKDGVIVSDKKNTSRRITY